MLRRLVARGGDVRYCDPHFAIARARRGELYPSVEYSEEEVRAADCVVMLTQHREFLETPRWDQARLVVDTRNVVPPAPHVSRSVDRMVLILGAGYIGAAVAELALARGEPVTLADNWHATGREQLDGLERAGARVETADVRDRAALDALLELEPDRVVMLAAQASRPISEREPDYTEQVNLTGARRVAEARRRLRRARSCTAARCTSTAAA